MTDYAGSAPSGSTPFPFKSAATTNSTSVIDHPTMMTEIIVINTTATLYYLKFYNKASAPTVGTDAVYFTVPIPANTSGAGFVLSFAYGCKFSNGLGFGLTSGLADNDTGAAATGVAITIFAQ